MTTYVNSFRATLRNDVYAQSFNRSIVNQCKYFRGTWGLDGANICASELGQHWFLFCCRLDTDNSPSLMSERAIFGSFWWYWNSHLYSTLVKEHSVRNSMRLVISDECNEFSKFTKHYHRIWLFVSFGRAGTFDMIFAWVLSKLYAEYECICMCVFLCVWVCGCVSNNNNNVCLYHDTLRHWKNILVVQKLKHTTLLVLWPLSDYHQMWLSIHSTVFLVQWNLFITTT